MNNKKHEFDKCPDCGVDVSGTDSNCWKCLINLEIAYNKIHPEFKKNKLSKKTSLRPVNKKPLNVKNVLLLIFLVILIIHLIPFLTIFGSRASSGINVKAKAYMTAANVMTFLYVIPIQQVLTMDNALVGPFQSLRDYLFARGAENIPKDDAETNIWWFAIKYPEFCIIVEPRIVDYGKNKRKWLMDYQVEEVQKLISWTDELYNNLKPIAKLKIKDKTFRERRLNMFNAMAFSYLDDRYILMSTYLRELTGKRQQYDISDEEIGKLETIYYLYKQLFTYCKKQEKESYDYFFYGTNRAMYHYIVNATLCYRILHYMRLKSQKISCNNEFLNEYGKNWSVLKNEYSTVPLNSIDSKNLIWGGSYTIGEVYKWTKDCHANPNLQELRKDVNSLINAVSN